MANLIKPPAPERVQRFRETWQAKCLIVLRGPHTLPGQILLAALGKGSSKHSRFVSHATISPDGEIYAGYQKAGQPADAVHVCSVADLVKTFRKLADTLQLNDKDRAELFQCLKEWVDKDYRFGDSYLGEHGGL